MSTHLMKRGIAAALVLVSALGLVWFVLVRDTGSADKAAKAERTQPQLHAIGIDAPDFVSGWNAMVRADGSDFQLGAPKWQHESAINLDVASYEVGDWSLIELYRNAKDQITAVYLAARPSSPDQTTFFLNAATSVIATTMRIDRNAAAGILHTDLKADGSSAGEVNEKIERGRLKFALSYKDTAWQLTVTDVKSSAPAP